ncbi:neural cell adhesion molecule 2 [Cherax quadricarinatus]|uniref:neural cell adhesion molecule 2 n=1 Tax=Cherax quadricarinatus TaxID=27406 RepID=UPI00387E4288
MNTLIYALLLQLLLPPCRGSMEAPLLVFLSLLTPLATTGTLLQTQGSSVPRLASTVFSQQNNTELRSQVGTTAVLHCVAQNVGDNTVSWIRRRDYHLLTVGSQTYSSDDRFQVRYIKDENDWQLHIRYVQVRDGGDYECQVSSHPPVSLLSTLHVLEATSEILGGPEKYMRVGSSLRLVCVLRDNTQPPTYVFWYHNQHMINYHATREVQVENNGGLSVLFLNKVRPADSGNYTCAPSNTRPAHIHIHVLKGGETPAAIHSASGWPRAALPLLISLLLCLSSTIMRGESVDGVTESLVQEWQESNRKQVLEDGHNSFTRSSNQQMLVESHYSNSLRFCSHSCSHYHSGFAFLPLEMSPSLCTTPATRSVQPSTQQ